MKIKLILLTLLLTLNIPAYSMSYSHTNPPSQNIRYMSPKIYTPKGYSDYDWYGRESRVLLDSNKNKKTYNIRAIITISKSLHFGFYSIDINTGETDWLYYASSQDRDLDYNKILKMMNSY